MPFKVIRRLAYAAIGFVALSLVTYYELDATGGLKRWQLIALSGTTALFGPGQIAVRTISNWLGTVSFSERLRLEEPAKACIVGLAKPGPSDSPMTQIPIISIGITVFVVLRSPLHLLRGVQKRMVRVRLESNPLPSVITWTYKKGILGQCWREGRDTSLDHQEHFAAHADCTKGEWKKLDEELTMGLKYKDFLQIREYGYIFATKMVDANGVYRGCFVVQIPTGMGDELQSVEALALIHTSAALTCAVLS